MGLTYAVSASATLSALLARFYWKRCNTRGVMFGVIGGIAATVPFVLVSPRLAQLDSVDVSTAAARNEFAEL